MGQSYDDWKTTDEFAEMYSEDRDRDKESQKRLEEEMGEYLYEDMLERRQMEREEAYRLGYV